MPEAKNIRWIFIFSLFFIQQSLSAQNCVNTNLNGTSVLLACGAPCTSLSLKVPHLKSSSNYIFSEIPYAPYNYIVAGGTEDPSLYDDDKYSNAFDLPFNFCFYGQTYDKVVVGSNGILTFDLSNAGCENAFSINPPLPYGGTLQCDFEALYYPRAAIFGGFKDIDASLNASPADRKIQWRVEGTAPCRVFVVSYYHVGSFKAPCSMSIPNTFQIVLHESTGIIDVFFEDKSCNSLTNSSKSILGVQNWERDKAVAGPGMNAEVWQAKNKGFRFTPSGKESLFLKAELVDPSGAVLGQADTTTSVAGLLDLNFAKVCPGVNAPYSLLKTSYQTCATNETITVTDTIYFTRKDDMEISATVTNTECNYKKGTATVIIPQNVGLAPYTYSIDGGPPQSSNILENLDFGSHTINVNDASGCAGKTAIFIKKDTTLKGKFEAFSALCPGVADGKIIITPETGTAPFLYGFDGDGSSPDSTLSNLLPGEYIPTFEDANGCIGVDSIIVLPRTEISYRDSILGTTCINFDDGKAFIKGDQGIGAYNYQIGSIINSTGEFVNLKADTQYVATVRDSRGCMIESKFRVPRSPGIPLNPKITPTTCKGVDNGVIELFPAAGNYSYLLSPGNIRQKSNKFTNLAPGIYYVGAEPDSLKGCAGYDTLEVRVGRNDQFNVSFKDLVPTSCKAAIDGSATVMVTGGKSPYMYSLDGINYASNAVLTGIPSGAILVRVKDAAGCKDTVSVNIPTGAGIIVHDILYEATCETASDGKIVLDPENGKAPYLYEMDSGIVQNNNPVFKNLQKGTYNFDITDANGCKHKHTSTIGFGAGIKIGSTVKDTALCLTNPSGKILIHATGGNDPYYYSIDSAKTFKTDSLITGLLSGNYQVSIKDSVGCTASAPLTMVNKNLPLKSTIAVTPALCEGSKTGKIVMNPLDGFGNYKFSVNGGNFTTKTTFDSLTAGNYSIRLEDKFGCYNNFDTIVRALPGIVAKVQTTNTSCPEIGDGTIVINASGGYQPYTYTVDNDTLSGNSATQLFYGTKNITVSDKAGCLFRESVIVNAGSPLITRANSTPSCIMPKNGTITIEPQNGRPPFIFKIDSLVLFGQKSFFNSLGAGSYTVVTTDSKGCKDTLIQTVESRDPVPAQAGDDVFTGAGNPTQLIASGGTNYRWEPAQYVSDPNLFLTTATVDENTMFTVQVTDQHNCIGYDSIQIKIISGPEIYVPTAFSPNGDGLNDIFKPLVAGMPKQIFFRIYNRFGELIYESADFSKGWDGTFKGKPQPLATYVWNVRGIDAFGKPHEKKGYVVLVR